MDTTVPIAPTTERPKYHRLLAPWWHTLILIAILLLVSGGQARTLGGMVERHGRLPLYIPTILFEWIMVGFVWMGIRRRGIRLRDLVGGRWKSAEDVLIDCGIALGFWIASSAVLAGLQYAMGMANMSAAREKIAKMGFLFPQSKLEMIVYATLAVTAGICEEIIFRGYLQKQFHAMTGNRYLGALMQAILFGAGHGYQGPKLMIVIAVYGLLFGLLAMLRGSLRPGMMAHAWQDLLSGFAGPIFARSLH